MNCPECKELKVLYDKCIKEHLYNKFLNWSNKETPSTLNVNKDEDISNPCGKYFEDYKDCVDIVMMKRIEKNKK